jgi:hypothetical protein
MPFDVRQQNTRAYTILTNYLASVTEAERTAFYDKLTVGQRALLHLLTRHVYAMAYQEGWEDSRTNP